MATFLTKLNSTPRDLDNSAGIFVPTYPQFEVTNISTAISLQSAVGLFTSVITGFNALSGASAINLFAFQLSSVNTNSGDTLTVTTENVQTGITRSSVNVIEVADSPFPDLENRCLSIPNLAVGTPSPADTFLLYRAWVLLF
jgi:hypothetical protein